MTRSFLTVIVLALAAGGCAAIAPPEGRPDVPIPAAWSHGGGDAAQAAPSADWWGGFGTNELPRLLADARANNPDLAAAAQRINQAAARIRSAGAGLYPTLDASGSAARDWSGKGPKTAGNTFRAGLDAGYEIDLWGLNRFTAEAAEAALVASDYDRQTVALTLSAEVAVAYFQYLSLGDRIDNARRILDIAERVLALIEAKAAFGAASGLDLAQQRSAVAQLRAALPTLEQSRAETLNGLAALLGKPPGAVVLEAASLRSLRLPSIAAGLPSQLLERRPDLLRAEANLAAARADVGAARAALFPSIRLTGNAGYSSDQLSKLFTPTGFLAGLAAGIAQPIFDGGRLRGQRDESEAREAELVQTYRSAVVAAFRDTDNALAAIRYLAEIEQAQAVATEESRRAYDLAELRYRGGAIDFLTVLETQRSLFQQEDALVQTRLARLTAVVGLFQALGGGW